MSTNENGRINSRQYCWGQRTLLSNTRNDEGIISVQLTFCFISDQRR